MRFIFLLLLLIGLCGAAYPLAAGRFDRAGEIGSFRVYEPASGFRAVTVELSPAQAPVEAVLVMSMHDAAAAPDAALGSATLTALRGERTLFAGPVLFRSAPARRGPSDSRPAFTAVAGRIETVEAGSYTFTAARGEADIPQVTALDLVLRHVSAVDGRIQPLGFALAAIGAVGLILASTRGSAPAAPRPRWGRAGDT
jgi:hypothetical protein